MGIATASLDYDRLPRPVKVSSPPLPELLALQSAPALAALPPHRIRALAEQASIRSFGRGAVLIAEGTVPTAAYLVLRGRVRAVRRGENGREVALEVFRAGDLIADAVFMADQPSPSSVEATEMSSVLVVPRDALAAELRAAPELALAFGQNLMRRLASAQDLAVGLALNDVRMRLLSTLRALGRQDGQELPEGVLVRHRPSQQELANRIGSCRETVSRIVSDLVRRGLLVPRGRSLLITKPLCSDAP